MATPVGRLGFVAALTLASCHPSPRPGTPITARCGPAELADGFAQQLPRWTFNEYAVAAFDRDVVVVHRASTLSALAFYGFGLSVDDKKPSWAIDRSPAGFVFVFDANANGSLDDDPVHPLASTDGDKWEVTIPRHARSSEPVFRLRLQGDTITIEPVTVRWGIVVIEGKPIEFGVFGVWGKYLGDVAFDADGDGRVELSKPSEFTPARRIVDLRGVCYLAEIDPVGDRIVLTPRPRALGGGCLEPDDAI